MQKIWAWGVRVLALSVMSMSTMSATTVAFRASDVMNAFNSTADTTIATECAPGSLASRTARCAIFELDIETAGATASSVSDSRWVVLQPANIFWWNNAGGQIHFITSGSPTGTQNVYGTNYTTSTNLPADATFLVSYTGTSLPATLSFSVGFVPLTNSGTQDGLKNTFVGGFSIPVQAVPEPGSVLLLASALGAAFCGRRFLRK